jgi:hypothetical protein
VSFVQNEKGALALTPTIMRDSSTSQRGRRLRLFVVSMKAIVSVVFHGKELELVRSEVNISAVDTTGVALAVSLHSSWRRLMILFMKVLVDKRSFV